ncbi:MAG: hypothetical protein ACXWYT_05560 [Actinomycetota bacterium]
MKRKMKKLIMAVVAAPLALGLTAGPAVAEQTQRVLPGAVHADGVWTYEDGHTESHTADLGVITGLVGDTITLTRADGVTVSNALPDDACVRVSGMPATADDLHFGMRALVISQVAEDGSTVRVVRAGFPLVRRYQPGCGLFDGAIHGDVTLTYADGTVRSFSFDRGTIESVTDGEILMQRPDGVAITTSTDDHTRILGAHPLGELAGRQALVISERIGDALLAKIVRARIFT